MSSYPSDRKYTEEHEWVHIEGGMGRVGITDHAQDELGDVVYLNLPGIDSEVEQSEPFGEVESVKAVSDLYAPVSGMVVEVNEELDEHPELVNEDPHGEGWMIVIELSDEEELESLMDADDYQDFIEGD